MLWVFVLAACTVQLAPSYDPVLANGLNEAHTEALTLFAAVEEGSPASKFSDFEMRYAGLIGRFETLRQRASMRDIPPLARRISRLSIVQDFCNSQSDPTSCVNASPSSMGRVLEVVRQMRNTHRSRGLAVDTVTLFRTDYSTAIEQALTVENALQR